MIEGGDINWGSDIKRMGRMGAYRLGKAGRSVELLMTCMNMFLDCSLLRSRVLTVDGVRSLPVELRTQMSVYCNTIDSSMMEDRHTSEPAPQSGPITAYEQGS